MSVVLPEVWASRFWMSLRSSAARRIGRAKGPDFLERHIVLDAGSILGAPPHRRQARLRVCAAFLCWKQVRADDLILALERAGPINHFRDGRRDRDVRHLAARLLRLGRLDA